MRISKCIQKGNENTSNKDVKLAHYMLASLESLDLCYPNVKKRDSNCMEFLFAFKVQIRVEGG